MSVSYMSSWPVIEHHPQSGNTLHGCIVWQMADIGCTLICFQSIDIGAKVLCCQMKWVELSWTRTWGPPHDQVGYSWISEVCPKGPDGLLKRPWRCTFLHVPVCCQYMLQGVASTTCMVWSGNLSYWIHGALSHGWWRWVNDDRSCQWCMAGLGLKEHQGNGTEMVIAVHIQPASSASHSCHSGDLLRDMSKMPKLQSTTLQFVCLMSSARNPGPLTMFSSFLKLLWDVWDPWFQYHLPSRKELSFGYGMY